MYPVGDGGVREEQEDVDGVGVRIDENALAEFLEVIKEDAVRSEGDEPGCLRFDVLRDNNDIVAS